MNIPSSLTDLFRFRADLYTSFGRRQDALFELTDAALTAGLVPSLAYRSLEGSHRRGWGSPYAALAKGTIDVNALRHSELAYRPTTISDPSAFKWADTTSFELKSPNNPTAIEWWEHPGSRRSSG